MARGKQLVVGRPAFFERVGERIMADVMQQRGELDFQLPGHATGEMVRTNACSKRCA